MARFQSLSDAVRDNLHDRDIACFEGFTHLIPHAAAHEAIRQGISELTLLRMTPDIIYDQMIGMGVARKLIFSYLGNPGVGVMRRLRDAIENNWPRNVQIVEHSHAAMANAFDAGAARMPCAIFRGYHGVTLKEINSEIRTLICPFTGEELAIVPALRPDVTFIHAQRANKRGDVLIEGITGVSKEAALAAKRVVVTVEEVVDAFSSPHPNACVLPHWIVTAIATVPGGAHPSYAMGFYDRDNLSYLEWDRIAADREVFMAWMKLNVLEASPDVFAQRVERLRKHNA